MPRMVIVVRNEAIRVDGKSERMIVEATVATSLSSPWSDSAKKCANAKARGGSMAHRRRNPVASGSVPVIGNGKRSHARTSGHRNVAQSVVQSVVQSAALNGQRANAPPVVIGAASRPPSARQTVPRNAPAVRTRRVLIAP